MPSRILFVDDEANILQAFKRTLRSRFAVETAMDGFRGLEIITEKGPFDVVVSDLRMPAMSGIQFLSRVRTLAPDTTRIMLTGFAELQSAIDAVNEGHIFRFLTKPCTDEVLVRALNQGIHYHRLVTAERELLQKTLKGIIKMLTDLLSMVNPEAFGRASRIQRYAARIASHMGMEDAWKVETAALLSQIGCLILPEDILQKVDRGQPLKMEELSEFKSHPRVASRLLANIPRMEEIAEMLGIQAEDENGSTSACPAPDEGNCVAMGANILKTVLTFDLLESQGTLKPRALKQLKQQPKLYDPLVVEALESVLGDEAKYISREIKLVELAPQMILARDIMGSQGQVLVTRGQEVSPILIERLERFSKHAGVAEPIQVFVPIQLEKRPFPGTR